MAKATLEQILDEVKALTREEQEHLRKTLDTLLSGQSLPSDDEREDELERRLFEAGLLSEIKPPITDLTPYQGRTPVEIKGKPLSETIIEERR